MTDMQLCHCPLRFAYKNSLIAYNSSFNNKMVLLIYLPLADPERVIAFS